MTAYIVLKQRIGGAERDVQSSWDVIGPPVDAVSDDAAIRKAVDGQSGTYNAIPVRSWKPVTVTVETVKRITLA